MTQELLKTIQKFQKNASNMNQILLGFASDDMLLLTTDYRVARTAKSFEKKHLTESKKAHDIAMDDITLDANKDLTEQITNLDQYSNAISYLKPHLIDESIYEPIQGICTIIFSTTTEKIIEHNARLTAQHITPGENDFWVDNPKVMHLYSVIAHSIIGEQSSSQAYDIYKTFNTSFDEATKELDRQISEDIQNISEVEIDTIIKNSDLESEK